MPQRMRPVDDVIKRVLHDRLFDPALVRVGYVDRLTDGGARCRLYRWSLYGVGTTSRCCTTPLVFGGLTSSTSFLEVDEEQPMLHRAAELSGWRPQLSVSLFCSLRCVAP